MIAWVIMVVFILDSMIAPNSGLIIEYIEEIRLGDHGGLHPGLYDRAEQWIDPDFPHNEDTIGYCEARPLVKGWRPSAGINQDMHIFYDGTDPDDVHQGVLHDGWLLSAIQILAASGGVG